MNITPTDIEAILNRNKGSVLTQELVLGITMVLHQLSAQNEPRAPEAAAAAPVTGPTPASRRRAQPEPQ